MRQEIIEALEELKTVAFKEIDPVKFLKVKAYVCSLNNGKEIKREKLIKGNTDGSAAIVFPITTDGKIILAIEPRVFTKNTVDIGFPGDEAQPCSCQSCRNRQGHGQDLRCRDRLGGIARNGVQRRAVGIINRHRQRDVDA